MRVLMISLDRGLFGGGSSGDVVARHRQYADAAGEMDVIVFASPKYEQKIWAENLRVIPTRSEKLAHFRKAQEIAEKLAREKKYDLLVTQEFAAPVGARLKRRFKLPWLVNVHSMFFSWQWLGFNPLAWYMFFLIRKSIRLADGFRVNNQDIRDKLLDWGIAKPILVQPTPIDIEKFKLKGDKTRFTSDAAKVLYVGRLEPEKNLALLIQTFKHLKGDFHLEIVGKGSLERELKRLAADDLRIEFFGARSFEELPEMYQGADIFVLPSNTESFGQVLLQAAAAGCALIATATAGARVILGDSEHGILVPVGSQSELKKWLGSLLAKRFEREYWSAKALEMASRYDAASGVSRTIMFWKEIAKR